jgi:hypothetical protein
VIRGYVANEGGRVELADGSALELKRIEAREIDPEKAWPLLTERLGERLVEAVSIGKGKVEAIVSAGTPNGFKGKAIGMLMAQLDEAGALRSKVSHQLKIEHAKGA